MIQESIQRHPDSTQLSLLSLAVRQFGSTPKVCLTFYGDNCCTEEAIKWFNNLISRVESDVRANTTVYTEHSISKNQRNKIVYISRQNGYELDYQEGKYSNVQVSLLSSEVANEAIFKSALKQLKEFPRKPAKGSFSIVGFSDGDYTLNDFSVKLDGDDSDFFDNYNDELQDVHNLVVSKLSLEGGKGIVLLHGEPGTGKTTYIRYLISKLNKPVIYIPPDLTHKITEPGFLQFAISSCANKILLIEDAETVLMKRAAGDGQSVANLLNLSDGLLGDALAIQIICTFNTTVFDIDPALKRKGRLIAEYQFKELGADKTKKLLAKLYGRDDMQLPKTTLSEIYNIGEYIPTVSPNKFQIGFAVTERDHGPVVGG